MKKGQFSIFIILSLVIVILFILIINLKFDSDISALDKELDVDSDFSSVRDYAQECLDMVSVESVYSIGMNGGYYEYFGSYVPFHLINVPIYYSGGSLDSIPSVKTIEEELSKSASFLYAKCVDNFTTFVDLGYLVKFNQSEINIVANITEEEVRFEMALPYTVTYSGRSASFEDHYSKVDIEFPKFHRVIKEFIDEQKLYPSSILLSKLNILAVANDMKYEYFSSSGNTIIYKFKFPDYEYMGEPFYWNFAVEYVWP